METTEKTIRVKCHCHCHRNPGVKHSHPCCDGGYNELPVFASAPPVKRFSANKFSSEADITFDPTKYSKFKFGCKDSAREFGMELANKFIHSLYYRIIKLHLHTRGGRIIVMSSPYEHVPTATFAMKDYFIRSLNAQLVSDGLQPVMEAKIYRNTSYKEDYGAMSKDERFKLMKNDDFYVDSTLLKNNVCLFLDDVVITGAHEHHILQMLEKFNLNKTNTNYFLYYAELCNDSANPNIENYLNYFYIKDLYCLDKLIKNEPFLLNTRVVKYILNSNHSDCVSFFNYQRPEFLSNLYHQALGNAYHLIPDYQQNLKLLESLI